MKRLARRLVLLAALPVLVAEMLVREVVFAWRNFHFIEAVRIAFGRWRDWWSANQ